MAFLNGIGILAAPGRGLGSLKEALQRGWSAPCWIPMPDGNRLPTYPIPPEALEETSLGRKVRRADRFSKIAVLAASDALHDAGLAPDVDRSRVGLILASAFNSHVTTFQFLDEIITYGLADVSPTVFSHSVQNAAAAYVSAALDIRGLSLTVTQVHFAFHNALLLAQHWLNSGRCDHVLVGSIDELGSVLQYVWANLLSPAPDGIIRPFQFAANPPSVPGEGCSFLLLSASPGAGSFGRLQVALSPSSSSLAIPASLPDLHILEADGTLPDESNYALAAAHGKHLAAYAPLFGSMTSGSCLQLAAAALMIREQKRFASPIASSSGKDLPICTQTQPAPIHSIHLTRLNCRGGAAQIHLTNAYETN